MRDPWRAGCAGPASDLRLACNLWVRAALAALQTAINADNMTQTSKVAHRALDLCLVMGAVSLTGRLRRIEEAADAGDAEIARGLASGIDPILTSTLSEMLSALESPASHGV